MPRFAKPLAYRWPVAMAAKSAAFSFPRSRRGPQSTLIPKGLFSVVLPWAQKSTNRAKFHTSPIMRKAVSAVSTCSSSVETEYG